MLIWREQSLPHVEYFDTVIGRVTVIVGDIISSGDVFIAGRFYGTIKCRRLVISPGGRVVGALETAVTEVFGFVKGTIEATERLSIGRRGIVQGETSCTGADVSVSGHILPLMWGFPPKTLDQLVRVQYEIDQDKLNYKKAYSG